MHGLLRVLFFVANAPANGIGTLRRNRPSGLRTSSASASRRLFCWRSAENGVSWQIGLSSVDGARGQYDRSRNTGGTRSALNCVGCRRYCSGAFHLSRGRGAGIPTVRRANSRSTQYSSLSFCAAEQEALYGQSRTRGCRSLGHRTRPYLRGCAVLYGEYHGVQRRKSRPWVQYFGDPFEPGASRAQWVERMDQETQIVSR